MHRVSPRRHSVASQAGASVLSLRNGDKGPYVRRQLTQQAQDDGFCALERLRQNNVRLRQQGESLSEHHRPRGSGDIEL
jgi:hypothetical protein